MAQIWMTYEEIGRLLDCTAEAARQYAADQRLDRKRSRDGESRAKLGPELTALFFARIKASDPCLDLAIEELRGVHATMGGDAAADSAFPQRASTR